MKIRLMGTPEEVEKVVATLKLAFSVRSVSEPYANRGDSKLVRVYVEIDVK